MAPQLDVVRRRRLAAAALAGAVVLAAAAAGLTARGGGGGPAAHAGPAVYVDRDGRGGRCDDGRAAAAAASPGTPLCSISRALAVASPGSRILLRGGSYPALEIDRVRPARPVTIAAQPGETVTLPRIRLADGAGNLRFSGLRLAGSPAGPSFQVMDGGSSHVTLANSDVRASEQDAIELRWGTRDVTIEGNRIHTFPRGSGIVFSDTSDLPGSPYPAPRAPISDVVIRGNHLDGIAIDGIRPANFDHLTVEGNEIDGIRENGAHCDAFQSVFGGRHLVFRNNFIHDNTGQGLFIKDGEVTDAVVENNVFVHNHAELQVDLFDVVGLRFLNNTVWDNELTMILRGVRRAVVRNNLIEDMEVEDAASARAEIAQDHNVIGGGWSWGARPGDLRARPRFVDAAREDYRLAAGSPGVDAGATAGAPPRDKACRRRVGPPDAGALERSPQSRADDTRGPGVCARTDA